MGYGAYHVGNEWLIPAAGFLVSFLASMLLIWPLIRLLKKIRILDFPNERSSHAIATPRGAGIVVVSVIVVGWIMQNALSNSPIPFDSILVVSFLAVALAILSWIDDLRGLPPVLRLLAHTAAAAATYHFAPFPGPVFQGIFGYGLDMGLTIFFWVWFINLFNFMDGIDGISAVEMVSVNLGIIALGFFAPELKFLSPYSAVLIGAALGFLVWNWPPARIFLGDVGSAPIGYLLGWQILVLSSSGAFAAALILPAYYLADSSITLLRRYVAGRNVWKPHREHFYQRAVSAGASHKKVSLAVFFVGVLLSAIATLTTVGYTIEAIGLAALVVGLTLTWFAGTWPKTST